VLGAAVILAGFGGIALAAHADKMKDTVGMLLWAATGIGTFVAGVFLGVWGSVHLDDDWSSSRRSDRKVDL
jgi:hypothetical protein